MTREQRRIGHAAAAVLAALVATGCSTGATEPGTSPSPSTASPAGAAESSTAAASPSGKPTKAPRPGSMDTPATSSGPLSQASFPRPGQIGPEWEYAVDRGDAEEGYAGNGTPAVARDPQEVALAAVPMGCPRDERLPVAEDVLEVDYSADGTKVIALRAAFASKSQASSFFVGRSTAIDRCVGRDGGAGIGILVGQARSGTDFFASDRTPDSDPWVELSFLDGDQVVLVATQARFDEAPMTSRQIQRLSTAFGGTR